MLASARRLVGLRTLLQQPLTLARPQASRLSQASRPSRLLLSHPSAASSQLNGFPLRPTLLAAPLLPTPKFVAPIFFSFFSYFFLPFLDIILIDMRIFLECILKRLPRLQRLLQLQYRLKGSSTRS
ncbi:MAG: hypothetical protein Q8P67_28795 [archaeon]|nr:hypothetical protein [archaeon]